MANGRDRRKPPGKPPVKGTPRSSGGSDSFDLFLDRQFKILRDEIDTHLAGRPAQKPEGKALVFNQRSRKSWATGPLKYGIAAAVLVAIVVPSVIQLNRHKETMNTTAAGATLNQRAGETKDSLANAKTDATTEAEERVSKQDAKAGYFARKKGMQSADRDELEKEEANIPAAKGARKDDTADLMATKREAPAIERAEKSKNSDRLPSVAKPAEEQASPAKPTAPSAGAAPAPRSMPAMPMATGKSSEADKAAEIRAGDEVAPTAASRSIAVDDAKTRLKKQSASDEEKEEMEKLWREFEKDPKSFNKDKKRSARLKVLLSRHNEKSRAKRVKSVETELAK